MTKTTYAPRPTIATTAPWDFPAPEEFCLSNGIRVWHFELPGQRLCEIQIVLAGSVLDDPEGKEGLCTLASEALIEGPRGTDSASFTRALQAQGAYTNVMASTEGTVIQLSAPANRIADACELVASSIIDPRLDPTDVARLKSIQLESIAMNQFDLASRGRLEFAAAYFPSGRREQRSANGTITSVQSLDAADVESFVRTHFTAAGAVIVTAGDFAVDRAESLLESAFAAWSGDPSEHAATESFSPATTGTVLVEVPDSPLTHLTFAMPTPLRTDADWADVAVAVNALGGSMESLLNIRLREEKGYTYGVSSRVNATTSYAYVMIETSVDARVSKEAAADILDVVTSVLNEGLTAEDHDRSVRELTGATPLSFERSGDIASMAGYLSTMNLTTDWMQEERRAIEATTVETIRQALANLPLDDSLLIAVGSNLGEPSDWQDLGRPCQALQPVAALEASDAERH